MPTLAAIVPATNSPPTLEECLRAIRAADDVPEEIDVVDAPRHAGPAEARNTGAARARADVLVFVDADVLVHRDAFARIRGHFAADPELVAVFGSYDDDPPGGAVSAFRNLLHHHVHQSSPGPAASFWAGLGAIRREAFQAAGGFDAGRYPRPSVEDVELGLRLTREGARILLDPEILGRHTKAWTLPGMIRTDVFDRGVPWVELLLSTRTGTTALNLSWRHRASAGATVAVAVALAARRPAAAATALGVLLILNHGFYGLLARRRGIPFAVAGVGLHALHHLASAAAVPIGLGRALARRRT